MIEKIKALIKKVISDKELMRYILIGVLTTVVNYGVYALCTRVIHMEQLLANLIAWVAAVIFAYVANKLYVFESHTDSASALVKEIFNFVLMRVASLVVDQAIIWLLVKQLGLYDLLCKLISNVVVVVLNYVFSKLFIFKKNA